MAAEQPWPQCTWLQNHGIIWQPVCQKKNAGCGWFDEASDWCVVWSGTERYYIPTPRVGSIKRWCTSDVCLTVTYIGPKLRTERPRKTKIGTDVAHVTPDSDTTFKVKGQLAGGRGILWRPHAQLLVDKAIDQWHGTFPCMYASQRTF